MSYTYNKKTRKSQSTGHSEAYYGMVSRKSRVRCGCPSSRFLHNPDVRQINRGEKKAKAILAARREARATEEREKQRKRMTQEQLVTPQAKQSRFGRFITKAKQILNKKIF